MMVYIFQAWLCNNVNFGVEDYKFIVWFRGVCVNCWVIKEIIDVGFGLVIIYYGEIDLDCNNFQDGIYLLFYEVG